MNVNGVTLHTEISYTDTHPLSLLDFHDVNTRGALTIESEPVKSHGSDIGIGITRRKVPFLEHDGEFPVGFIFLILRMNNHQTAETERILLHYIETRVIHEGAALVKCELVDMAFTGKSDRFRHSSGSILCVGNL